MCVDSDSSLTYTINVSKVTTLVHQLLRWRQQQESGASRDDDDDDDDVVTSSCGPPSSDTVETMIAASLEVACATLTEELERCATLIAEVNNTIPIYFRYNCDH